MVNFKIHADFVHSCFHIIKKLFNFAFGLYSLIPSCHNQTSSFMMTGKVAYAVPSMAESQYDKAVQSGYWVGSTVQTLLKAFTRRCV